MINFYFESDEGQHICQVQLVHSQLYNVRKHVKHVGAHKMYSAFRAALELLGMLDVDPEEGTAAEVSGVLVVLAWEPGAQGAGGSRRYSSAVSVQIAALNSSREG